MTGEELRQQLEARGAEAARRESEGRQAEAEGLELAPTLSPLLPNPLPDSQA